MRRKMKVGKDRRVFRNTAVTHKKINLYPKLVRGGFSM